VFATGVDATIANVTASLKSAVFAPWKTPFNMRLS